ncbi:Protein BatD [Sulfidibacter corallicola]|uniref:Protein BatD n=1 Tax=Sulfidibacter corallicola TaxID=2818388 RepID=A0A8A4TN95_SULCO|nr:BatD family protein [Sulfidibacter corallicola]QTD51020.1 protein BatD [Sulfidibacter corallicola]
MRRIGFLALVLLLPGSAAFAQDPNVTFSIAPREVGLNELVQFTIQVEGGPRGRAPNFPNGFELGDFELAQRRPSTSMQTTIVNGKVTSTNSYTYLLRPTKKGTFELPSQAVQVAGKTFQSPKTQISVKDEVRNLRSTRSRSPIDSFQNDRRNQRQQQAEIFAEMSTSKSEYFIGEPIAFQVKIFRTPGVNISSNGSSMSLPDFRDFWVEEVDRETWQDTVIRDSKRYEVDILAERLLYANKTGKLTVDPTEFELAVSVGRSFFADWQRVRRSTNALELTIKPLPAEGKPANFTGLVGSFSVKGELDKSSISLGDSVSLKVEIAGDGNFAAVSDITLDNLKRDFEVYEGGTPTSETRGGRVISKTWVFALVPKREGDYQIPLPRVGFFNTEEGRYHTSAEKILNLEVTPGERLAGGQVSVGRESGTILAEQNLNYIKLGDLGDISGKPKLQRPMLLVQTAAGFLVLDLLVFVGLLMRSRGQDHKNRFRSKYAWKNFQKAVGPLKSKEGEPFYAGLADALLGYFGDKWDRPAQGISLEMIRNRLEKDGIEPTHFDDVNACMESIELARFTPGSAGAREQLLNKTVATVKSLEGVLS